jgi:hypothetical protein
MARSRSSYSFFHLAKLLELGPEGRVIRVPCKAAVNGSARAMAAKQSGAQDLPDK